NRTAYAKGHYETEANFIRPSELPKITENLLSRGYKEKDVRAIMGENWLRVTKLVWK
ncbi:MAG TPA: peptidase M19, partial [Sphingomonadales bacterium]|nr:peptidase M19 [Sphingomonadales bacterium]